MAGGNLPESFREFTSLLKMSLDERRISFHDGRLYYLPEELAAENIRGLRFLRTGLYLGEIKGKHFEPSQALAMFLKKEEVKRVLDFPAEDERALRYLKGESLEVEDIADSEEKGWTLVCVDGFPLGWGKLADGRLKNKYYPGWRW